MKLFIETDEGEIIEVKELKNVNVDSNILIFFIKQVAKLKDLENVEWLLSQKTGKTCVILDGCFSEKVYGA